GPLLVVCGAGDDRAGDRGGRRAGSDRSHAWPTDIDGHPGACPQHRIGWSVSALGRAAARGTASTTTETEQARHLSGVARNGAVEARGKAQPAADQRRAAPAVP